MINIEGYYILMFNNISISHVLLFVILGGVYTWIEGIGWSLEQVY